MKKIIKNRNKIKPMYDLGIQKIQIPQSGSIGDIIGNTTSLTATGAQLGSNFGPYGTAIGAGTGLVTGLTKGIMDYNNTNTNRTNDLRINKNTDILNQMNGAQYSYQGDIYNQKYKAEKGVSNTKNVPIEIEGNELVFSKDNGRFKLKKIANGPSHEQGGIDYTAKEGDVIFPAEMKEKVLNLYKKGDYPSIESLRMKLPSKPTAVREETSEREFKKGTSRIHIKPENKGKFNATKARTGKTTEELTHSNNPVTRKRAIFAQNASHWHHKDGIQAVEHEYGNYSTPKYSISTRDLDVDYRHRYDKDVRLPLPQFACGSRGLGMYEDGSNGIDPNELPYGYNDLNNSIGPENYQPQQDQSNAVDMNYNYQQSGKVINQPRNWGFNMNSVGNIGKNINSAIGTGIEYAPTLYNIGQGVFGKPEVAQGQFYNPQKYQYNDMSDPNRRRSNVLERIQNNNARNASGGNIQNYTANAGQNATENFYRQQDINNYEYGRKSQINNMNTEQGNQAQQYNLREQSRINDINSANRARQRDYLSAGLEGLSKGYQLNKRQTGLEGRDKKLLGILGSNNFSLDPNDPNNYNILLRK